jgi:zinc transporter
MPEEELAAADALVSLRAWSICGVTVTVSLRRSAIIDPVLDQFRSGRLHDSGDILIALAVAAGEAIDPLVAGIGDDLDALECQIDAKSSFALRRRVTALRTRAVEVRRFVQPQRQALDRLALLPVDWLDDIERASVREGSDRFARMTEELESIRERAAVLHDELTDLRAEKLDTRSLQIAIVAMIFLPLTFITGLMGMNVGGVPYAAHPHGFWVVTAICLIIGLGVAAWFTWRGWSRGG